MKSSFARRRLIQWRMKSEAVGDRLGCSIHAKSTMQTNKCTAILIALKSVDDSKPTPALFHGIKIRYEGRSDFIFITGVRDCSRQVWNDMGSTTF